VPGKRAVGRDGAAMPIAPDGHAGGVGVGGRGSAKRGGANGGCARRAAPLLQPSISTGPWPSRRPPRSCGVRLACVAVCRGREEDDGGGCMLRRW